jgi:hypothetical protein
VLGNSLVRRMSRTKRDTVTTGQRKPRYFIFVTMEYYVELWILIGLLSSPQKYVCTWGVGGMIMTGDIIGLGG